MIAIKCRLNAVIVCQTVFTLQELADGLMNVKLAIDDIRMSKTLKQVLGTLLAIGNFLNGKEVSAYCIHIYVQHKSCCSHFMTHHP